jgi:hypothetical protein
MRTSHEDKRTALRNAVLHAALPAAPDASLQLIFRALIDRFTVWHLRLLRLFQNPKAWLEENGCDYGSLYMGGLSDILDLAYSGLSTRREFYDLVWADLAARGLTKRRVSTA